jgi:hypothetical protein
MYLSKGDSGEWWFQKTDQNASLRQLYIKLWVNEVPVYGLLTKQEGTIEHGIKIIIITVRVKNLQSLYIEILTFL